MLELIIKLYKRIVYSQINIEIFEAYNFTYTKEIPLNISTALETDHITWNMVKPFLSKEVILKIATSFFKFDYYFFLFLILLCSYSIYF